MSKYYHYFVEGADEKKIVDLLKTELRFICAGKVEIFNVVEEKLTKLRLMSIKSGTTAVLIFDTDTGNVSTLLENIKFLKDAQSISDVLCITQVCNLEDELKRSCNIRQISELTGSKSNRDFKHDLIKANNFERRLMKLGFNFEKFWNTNDTNEYKNIINEAYKIKLK